MFKYCINCNFLDCEHFESNKRMTYPSIKWPHACPMALCYIVEHFDQLGIWSFLFVRFMSLHWSPIKQFSNARAMNCWVISIWIMNLWIQPIQAVIQHQWSLVILVLLIEVSMSLSRLYLFSTLYSIFALHTSQRVEMSFLIRSSSRKTILSRGFRLICSPQYQVKYDN